MVRQDWASAFFALAGFRREPLWMLNFVFAGFHVGAEHR
jgi:hypothetical protein